MERSATSMARRRAQLLRPVAAEVTTSGFEDADLASVFAYPDVPIRRAAEFTAWVDARRRPPTPQKLACQQQSGHPWASSPGHPVIESPPKSVTTCRTTARRRR